MTTESTIHHTTKNKGMSKCWKSYPFPELTTVRDTEETQNNWHVQYGYGTICGHNVDISKKTIQTNLGDFTVDNITREMCEDCKKELFTENIREWSK